jgi:hypothetical protein
MDVSIILAGATIEGHLQNNGTGASSSMVPMHQQAPVCDPSLNIYRRRFDFHPKLSTFPFLFLLHPQLKETSAAGADEAKCDLLTTDVNYASIDECADQDDFLLALPLHRHLFSRLTCPLLSALLLVRDPRDRGSQCGEDFADSPR